MDFNRESFSSMFAEFLDSNPYHTTLFGRFYDLSNDGASEQIGEWIARMVFDCVQWEKDRVRDSVTLSA